MLVAAILDKDVVDQAVDHVGGYRRILLAPQHNTRGGQYLECVEHPGRESADTNRDAAWKSVVGWAYELG